MENQKNQQTSNNSLVNSYSSSQTSTTQVNNNQANIQATTQANTLQANTQTAASNVTNEKRSQVVIGVFDYRDSAESAINELRSKGFTREEINIISKRREDHGHDNEHEDDHNRISHEPYDDDITDGTLTGGTLGGIGGLILGAGALVIPGIGPILAMGPIATAIGGAIAGGIAGGLIDYGIPSEVSRRYEQDVAHGHILAIIKTNSNKVDAAAQILRQHGAKDVESHS